MRFISLSVILLLSFFVQAQTFISVGPDGGDVRSLSADPANPQRILLGTSAGQIYQSTDAGKTWLRFVRIGKGNDYVIDHIIFDPKQSGTIYVAAWTLEHEGGSVFKSTDDGHSWAALAPMEGKSVRALAMAASDPNTLVAGALDGVYRSRNAGETWTRISPESSAEIKNIESIAIDPADPEAVYAGTWHLPWKTTDGGRSWHSIKQGVIDDSDVFSIIIDPAQPQVVYASACSGIYKSENAGELFHKIQGIPFSARRTRVLKQDPQNHDVVYAGTTEGLFKTSDGGKTWRRITSPEVIINDVLIDARDSNHVMLATDRGGVLASGNAGASFESSNTGFAHRQVAALAVDPDDQNTLYAGLINDKQYGGVFVSHDQGAHWKQISAGLGGRDIFALGKAEKHLLAGTSNGVYELTSGTAQAWRPLDHIANVNIVTVRKATKTRKALTRKVIRAGVLHGRVTDIQVHDKQWVIASTQGIFVSSNSGLTWEGGPLLGHSDFTIVRASSKLIAAAGRNFLLTSYDDGGEQSKAGCQFVGCEWREAELPKVISSINDLAFGPDESIWLACREGLYRSKNHGETWQRLETLPIVNLASILYDGENHRMLVTGLNSTEVFSSENEGKSWKRRESGWLLRTITPDNGRLIAATAFDGVVIEQPSAVAAGESASSAASGVR
ncbi:MAG TPA: hypothetical protein VG498_07830 [Terriglobales bacterium]|nr:hypothetical protein [Terriglobales bacterium]